MELAVTQLRNLEGNLLRLLLRLLLDVLDLPPYRLVLRNLLEQSRLELGVPVQFGCHGLLDLIDNPRPNVGVAELVLRLRLENRVFKAYRNDSQHPRAHIR